MTTRGSFLLVGVVLVAMLAAWLSIPAPGTSTPRPRPEVVAAPATPAPGSHAVTTTPARAPAPAAPEVIPVPGLPFKGVVAVPGGIAVPPNRATPGLGVSPAENDAGWEALRNGEPYVDPDWFPEEDETDE